MTKRLIKKASKKSRLEIRHSEIVKQLQTTFSPLSDNTSLAQPSPFRIYTTVVTYSAYEQPILS